MEPVKGGMALCTLLTLSKLGIIYKMATWHFLLVQLPQLQGLGYSDTY